ncbi:peptidoglycan-recognition protein SC2 isoform X2 [Plutella xylostella]|uniref:peptidoglycan-recognition protein SC2 isoform X2 n=1 Tax=Plutella xylostella TaxID=51655 RepID=UPI002032899B|nr:peptidoglycan-recognition protein SC2 isoform X2 [Plutella xylostella]
MPDSENKGDFNLVQSNNAVDRADCAPAVFPAEVFSQCPRVEQLTVTKSSRVQVGPKFISVTQHITNNEVVKVFGVAGRILGLDLESSRAPRRCRASVAVFTCWTLLVACCLSGLLMYFITPSIKRLDIGLNVFWYLRRGDWQAMQPYTMTHLNIPVRLVVFGHSAETKCTYKRQCIEHVLNIQQQHLRRDFLDIGPNFLVGGSGLVFEGRGANIVGAMVGCCNSRIISIMFIGDYNIDELDEQQIENVKTLLDTLTKVGVLVQDYEIMGMCQLQGQTSPPGPNIMKMMHRFPHWNPMNASGCIAS